MNKQEAIRHVLPEGELKPKQIGEAFAPSNIALCKYWGKRNTELNLPVTSSLSISLGTLGTTTRICFSDHEDVVELNGEGLTHDHPFATRLCTYLDLFRNDEARFFHVATTNTIPTAAGLASSASGFAALVKALDDLFGWNLSPRSQSILARIGSGSASRSIFDGFVEWHAGASEDGMDSFAEPVTDTWPELRLGLLKISTKEKEIGSREAMNRTTETSTFYEKWPVKVAHDLMQIKCAIREKDFEQLGEHAESNALNMHATMIAAWPPVLYWQAESIQAMHTIWSMRRDGTPVFFTMDAGPNLKLLFLQEDQDAIQQCFPNVEVVCPFHA